MKKLSKVYLGLVLMFLYAPIFVLIVFSFNTTKSRSVMSGFTLDWYAKLFQNEIIMSSLVNTIIIAVIASVTATILGTAAAIGINSICTATMQKGYLLLNKAADGGGGRVINT